MNALGVLRTVRSERRRGWGGATEYRYEDLRRDLGIAEVKGRDLSPGEISGIMNGRPTAYDRKILGLITGDGDQARFARAAIEASLGLPGLFLCHNRSEVVDFLKAADGDVDHDVRIVVPDGEESNDFGITRTEEDAIQFLYEALVDRREPVQHWDAPFNAGSSSIVGGLWHRLAENDAYSAMWVLRTADFEDPYGPELRRLRQALHDRAWKVDTRHAVAEAIAGERILVVLLSPFILDVAGQSNYARGLLKEFMGQSGKAQAKASVLVVGQSTWVSALKVPNREGLSNGLKRRLGVQVETAFEEFQAQWKRFAGLREEVASEVSGSRMRRAATYFRVQNKEPVWPISVKLRALFASNARDASYFDPTQGLTRLAGGVYGDFGDIAAYVDDVSDYLAYARHVDRTAGRGSSRKRLFLYLLQYVSTSLHWLTEEALECLIDRTGPDRKNDRDLETEKRRMALWAPIITQKRGPAGDDVGSRYVTSMGVKAVVQDDWIASEPYLRSLAHYRVAKRLKDNENDKRLLAREYPYEPHWGRSRVFFLAEAIRHLVRSSETFEGQVSDADGKHRTTFPEPPRLEDLGTDPAVVINYCYSVLYQELLNGNANGRSSRSLAKRYGAYQLSVEMLELVSENYVVGVPHPDLKPENRHEFMRECGFALLDVGELVRSRHAFDQARVESMEADNALDGLSGLLDLALVDCVSGNLDTAEAALEEARDTLVKMHSAASAGDKSLTQIRKLYRRLMTREAHLAFLSGNAARALDLLDQLENEARWSQYKEGLSYGRAFLVPSFARSLEAEQIHLKVAALYRCPESERPEGYQKGRAVALNICLREMLHAESNGLHHQAMGFRIAIARCFRREGRLDAAEVVLDAVHRDLLRYGCSERTFLNFLNEAGRVVGGRADPIRAYATYLKPCLVRARARGFRREAQQAAVQASEMLKAILTLRSAALASGDSSSWDLQLKEAVAEHGKLVAETEHVFSGDLLERDPLYAYAIADAETVIGSLVDPVAIEAERTSILAFLEGRESTQAA